MLLNVEKLCRQTGRQTGRVIIAASVAKGDRFDWLVSKCTELGVDRICPVLFERTVKAPRAQAAVRRYSKLAISAAKQCGRVFLPQIDPPTTLGKCLEILKKDYPAGRFLAGSCDGGAQALVRMKYTNTDVTAFVGPEGGMTENEQKILTQQGAVPVRLTGTILRIETAGVAFAAILAANRDAASAESSSA